MINYMIKDLERTLSIRKEEYEREYQNLSHMVSTRGFSGTFERNAMSLLTVMLEKKTEIETIEWHLDMLKRMEATNERIQEAEIASQTHTKRNVRKNANS